MALFNTYDIPFTNYESVQIDNDTDLSIPESTINPLQLLREEFHSPSITKSSGHWYDNLSTTTNNNTITDNFPAGTVVTIDSKKSKYGHTAIKGTDGNWYSDFKQGTKINVYNDPNAVIHYYQNPNLLEAVQQANNVANKAGNHTTHRCALKVREGLGYAAEGYNGKDFGIFLKKHGWKLIGKHGLKLQYGGNIFNTYDIPFTNYEAVKVEESSPVLKSYSDLDDTSDILPRYHSVNPTKLSSHWYDNLSINSSNTPTSTQTSNTTIDSVINRIVKGGYATGLDYGNKLKLMVASVKNAKGLNKTFADKHYLAYLSRGLDLNTALVYTAQDALESGWGKHISGKYNYGGIKGKGTIVTTHEANNKGLRYKTKAEFRDFLDDDDYINYHINLLNKPLYNRT